MEPGTTTAEGRCGRSVRGQTTKLQPAEGACRWRYLASCTARGVQVCSRAGGLHRGSVLGRPAGIAGARFGAMQAEGSASSPLPYCGRARLRRLQAATLTVVVQITRGSRPVQGQWQDCAWRHQVSCGPQTASDTSLQPGQLRWWRNKNRPWDSVPSWGQGVVRGHETRKMTRGKAAHRTYCAAGHCLPAPSPCRIAALQLEWDTCLKVCTCGT